MSVSREEFLRNALQPEFGDAMNFQLDRVNAGDGLTFSMEGIDSLLEQVKDFVLARVYSRWGETGEPPSELLMQVKLGWDAYSEAVLDIGLPWWAGHDRLDGQTRGAGFDG